MGCQKRVFKIMVAKSCILLQKVAKSCKKLQCPKINNKYKNDLDGKINVITETNEYKKWTVQVIHLPLSR